MASLEINNNRHESRPLHKAVCRIAYAARKGKRVYPSDWKDVVKVRRLSSEVVSEANVQYIVVQVATPCNPNRHSA